MSNRRNALKRFAAAVLIGLAPAAAAQEYPAKPIRIITEYAPGTGGEVYMRILSQHISTAAGQPVVLESRAGGGGLLAAEFVARAAPDGYTVFAGSQNALLVRPFLAKTQSLDVFRDLAPVTQVWNSTTMILSHKSLPVRSLAELIAFAKANPGKISYATSGFGSSHHFSGEEIQQLAGIRMVHVPYKGGVGSMTALMTGEVPVAIGLAGSAVAAIKSGNVRVLGMIEGKGFMDMPNIPRVSDVIRGYEPPPSWTGLFVPAKVPPALVQRLNALAVKGLRDPAVPPQEGFELVANSPDAFLAVLRSQYALIGRLTKAAKIQPTD